MFLKITKKNLCLFLIIFFISFNVFSYGLSGNWQGYGQMVVNGALLTDNCKLFLEIEHTPLKYTTYKSDFFCPGMNIKSKKVLSLDIVNGRLYLQGVNIGDVSNNELYSPYTYSDGRQEIYHLKIDPITGTLLYRDHVEWSKSKYSEVTGQLWLTRFLSSK